MTDLTEKWKAGELEKGAYYVKDKRGNVYIDEYDDEYSCGYYLRTCFSSDNVSEVLARCQALKNCNHSRHSLPSIKNTVAVLKMRFWF